MTDKIIFIDADAFIAVYSENDTNHKRALKRAQQIEKDNAYVMTSTYVLLEVATILNIRVKKGIGTRVVNKIVNSTTIELSMGDNYIFSGIQTLSKQTNKNISLADCVYFSTAKHFGVTHIFSFDKHWVKNRFVLL